MRSPIALKAYGGGNGPRISSYVVCGMNTANKMDGPFDFLLIYLSEKRRGDWNAFLQAVHVLEIEDSPYGVAHRLCILAHLDFNYLTGDKSWNITTPALVMTIQNGQKARAVLTGKRNPALVEALQEQAIDKHAFVGITWQNRAPAVIEVLAESEEIIALIAYQMGLEFVRQASLAICLAMPLLETLVTQTPKESGVFGEVDAFDCETLSGRG